MIHLSTMLVNSFQSPFGVIFILLGTIELIEPVRNDVNEMMYVNIPGASACFRRLNGTHQFGCSSPFRGASGVIQVLYDSTSVEEFVKEAVAGPYVVVMQPMLFSRTTIDKLIGSNKVSGVVLAYYSNSTMPDHYSPDDVCPNRNEGYCDLSKPWNPEGNSFLVQDWPFPVFVVHDDEYLKNITDCYKTFNVPVDGTQLSRPLCTLLLKSHMFAAVNSEVCTRRMVQQMVSIVKFCDPLGSENIVFPMINLTETKEKKLIAVIARMDSATLFDGIAPGAMSAVSGSATLMVLAEILKDLRPVIKDHDVFRGLMFILLNGESFDFIGSQRIVYDMEQGSFMTPNHKITLEDIGMVIELSQLGPGKTFYVHRTADKYAEDFSNSLITLSKSTSVEFKQSSLQPNQLPPVSLNTFLSANSNISGIVVTNYDTSFTNRYYNGLFDNETNLPINVPASQFEDTLPPKGSTQHNLASAATVIARSIAAAINQNQAVPYDIKLGRYVQTINDVLQCYLVSRKCKLFEKLYPMIASGAKGPEVLSLYVGIPTSVSHITRATWKVLAYLGSDSETSSLENCTALCPKDGDLQCFWVKEETGEGKCVMSSARLLTAVSPAFEIEGYNWSSKQYSTWTESVWSETNVRMFVQGDHTKELVVFLCGLFIFFVSLASVYFINKNHESLFASMLIRMENC
uniref:Nicastrin n=1 Tax=Lygus hesperus TaxID=30085 RepID=A0A0A9X3V9_LYGHE